MHGTDDLTPLLARKGWSSFSPSAVEPLTSQKSAVTVLRCSRARPSTRAPRSGQNLTEPAASYPHSAQVATPEV
jgi:hypothetical protein